MAQFSSNGGSLPHSPPVLCCLVTNLIICNKPAMKCRAEGEDHRRLGADCQRVNGAVPGKSFYEWSVPTKAVDFSL
eukprot:g35325.t1